MSINVDLCTCLGKKQTKSFLTVYFQSGLSFHGAGFIGRHTREIPAMAGRRSANDKGAVLAHRKVGLLRTNFQAVPEPADFRMRRTWIHEDKRVSKRRVSSQPHLRQEEMHGGQFKDLLPSTEERVTSLTNTSVSTHTSKSGGARTGGVCWLLGAEGLRMSERRKRGTAEAYIVPNRGRTGEHVSGVQQSRWPHLSSHVLHSA